MSFFAGDVMIECTEVSREAGQGICAPCLEYAGLVTCNQHRPRVMPWRTRWSQSNTPESIGVLRIQCKHSSVQHMVPHSDMQSSSWILLKRDVRLKKDFFFFHQGRAAPAYMTGCTTFGSEGARKTWGTQDGASVGPRHSAITTATPILTHRARSAYLHIWIPINRSKLPFFFLTSSTLIAFF